MNLAIITLSREGACLAECLARRLGDVSLYVHESVADERDVQPFASIMDLTSEIFAKFRGLVFIAPTGVVVRAIAPHIQDKRRDPAVVAVDVGGRWAVSLLSGHEGGANRLAVRVGNILFAEPVISTTTEAIKTAIVGVGCRRGASAENIVDAVKQALVDAGIELSQVRLMASAEIKAEEPGLPAAAEQLGVPIRFVSTEEIRNSPREFQHYAFVQENVNIPAVAEPAALLAGRRTTLVLPRKIYNGVTVAVAVESCLWWA